MLNFFLGHKQLVAEALLLTVLPLVGFLTYRWHDRWLKQAERIFGRIARRRGLSVCLLVLLVLGLSSMMSLLGRMPEPHTHDEFSYLLGADTFAHGRLTNPTHLLWQHFESFHVIQKPTYASKFPPAQGLMLAAGQVLGGHAIVGVWISTALACAAIYWMLLAWVPPGWALLGGLLTALHPGVLLTWGQSYWGGAVAMLGGALVVGALRRIARQARVIDALLMGLGLAILANSRPYEGLVMSLPVALVLLYELARNKRYSMKVACGRLVLPISATLVLSALAMGYYNWRVTGNPLRLPYQRYMATYGLTPIFLWQLNTPAPNYDNKVLKQFYAADWLSDLYERKSSLAHLAKESLDKLNVLWGFYQVDSRRRLTLFIPLLMLPWLLRRRWPSIALLICGVFMVGILIEMWVQAHYGAPILALVVVLNVQAIRYLRLWRCHGWRIGRSLVWTVVMLTLLIFTVNLVNRWRDQIPWSARRAQVLRLLTADGEKHLVVMRYGPQHSPLYEWVYNGADIDGAAVVWAHELEPRWACRLLGYFNDRRAWLAYVDHDGVPPELVPYPETSCP
ncbi:MAG TPA: hypothetical protein VGW77_30825 [Candidatus Binatia bacterium]|jgi:hypothetical protein|nr:hypothetical protein [Candidatus Binatia bacterium]